MLGDPPVVEHDHLVDHVERGQAVGDDERRAPLHQLGDRHADVLLRLRIDAGRRLVENDEVRVAQPDAGKGEELRLARREPGPGGSEGTVDAGVDEPVEPDVAQRRLDVGIASAPDRTA